MKNKNLVHKISDWETLVSYMDCELREFLNHKLAPCTEAEFLKAYEKAHNEKFGEPFFIN